jgi:homoserine dehydrogenase
MKPRISPISVGLLGIGTVGGGTWDVLSRNADEIQRRAGRAIRITHVADKETKKARGIVKNKAKVVADAFEVVRGNDVEIVVELIGGTTVAKDLVLEAIRHGKHVVTANKALLATHGNEIFAAAQKKGVMVAFEAAVAGGVPIIKALREGLSANRIEWIAGIINGTSNFILSEMRDKGIAFADALKDAQKRGYAEADPTFDIEGVDAAHKLTILSALAFGIPMQFKRAYTEGISKLTKADIAYAEELGYRIKLLGITRRAPKGIELRVHPTLVPARRLIANVEGVMNGILVKGDAVGATLYYGAGAGSQPTASAVVADLVDVTRLITADPEQRVPHLAFQPDQLSDEPVLSIDQVETSCYLRMRVLDKPGVLADITRTLADSRISIEAMVQKEPGAGERQVDIVLLTDRAVEKHLNQAIAKIEKLPTVIGKVTRIRLEPLL